MTALLRFFGLRRRPKPPGLKNAHYIAVHIANVQASALR